MFNFVWTKMAAEQIQFTLPWYKYGPQCVSYLHAQIIFF